MKETVRLTFYGAAGTVTGSKFLVEAGKHKIMVDAGLFQGKKELRLRNWDSPDFNVKDLSAIVLTHAHIDHTGYLPRLVKEGYTGPVYCTAATKHLLGLLLPDSAYLQEEEAKFANRHGTSKHHPALPLYSADDAKKALTLLKEIPRGKTTEFLPGVTVSPTCAGHILGSTSLSLTLGGKRITFSGDVGQYDIPILPDPEPHPIGDVLLCESTYGDRDHAKGDVMAKLGEVISTAADRHGAIIIPAFALGRTQTVLYYLAELERQGKIPVLPVYVDSPMAVDATQIYRMFHHDYDDEARALRAAGETPLMTERTKFCKSVEDSKKLNYLSGARIIISASGMVTGGRVLHHMRNWLPHRETTVIFVGYQGTQTRGQIIQSGAEKVRIFRDEVPIRAHITTLSGLSAHGDRGELIRWLKSCSGSPKYVKVIHGEKEPAAAFSELVTNELGWKADPAQYKETIEI